LTRYDMQAADFFVDEPLLKRMCKAFANRLFSVYNRHIEASFLEVRRVLGQNLWNDSLHAASVGQSSVALGVPTPRHVHPSILCCTRILISSSGLPHVKSHSMSSGLPEALITTTGANADLFGPARTGVRPYMVV
jgi:hypothetical protein